jgi:hypothetical protein
MCQHAFMRTLRRKQSKLQQGEAVCVRQRASRSKVTASHVFNLGASRPASGQLHGWMTLYLDANALSKQQTVPEWDPVQMWTLCRRKKYLALFKYY